MFLLPQAEAVVRIMFSRITISDSLIIFLLLFICSEYGNKFIDEDAAMRAVMGSARTVSGL